MKVLMTISVLFVTIFGSTQSFAQTGPDSNPTVLGDALQELRKADSEMRSSGRIDLRRFQRANFAQLQKTIQDMISLMPQHFGTQGLLGSNPANRALSTMIHHLVLSTYPGYPGFETAEPRRADRKDFGVWVSKNYASGMPLRATNALMADPSFERSKEMVATAMAAFLKEQTYDAAVKMVEVIEITLLEIDAMLEARGQPTKSAIDRFRGLRQAQSADETTSAAIARRNGAIAKILRRYNRPPMQNNAMFRSCDAAFQAIR